MAGISNRRAFFQKLSNNSQTARASNKAFQNLRNAVAVKNKNNKSIIKQLREKVKEAAKKAQNVNVEQKILQDKAVVEGIPATAKLAAAATGSGSQVTGAKLAAPEAAKLGTGTPVAVAGTGSQVTGALAGTIEEQIKQIQNNYKNSKANLGKTGWFTRYWKIRSLKKERNKTVRKLTNETAGIVRKPTMGKRLKTGLGSLKTGLKNLGSVFKSKKVTGGGYKLRGYNKLTKKKLPKRYSQFTPEDR